MLMGHNYFSILLKLGMYNNWINLDIEHTLYTEGMEYIRKQGEIYKIYFPLKQAKLSKLTH